jgi:hypothetical protein
LRYRIVLFALAVVIAVPALAQVCSLEMTIVCNPGPNNTTSCTSTTRNTASTSCGGFIYTGWSSGGGGSVLSFTNSLGLTDCFDSGDFGIEGPPFAFCFAENGTLGPGGSFTSDITITGDASQLFGFSGFFDSETGEDRGSVFAQAGVTSITCTPTIFSPPVTRTGLEYSVIWTLTTDPSAQFIVQESTSPDFSSGVTERQVNGLSTTFRHDISTTTTYYYRVRATNCGGAEVPFSRTTSTVVQAAAPATSQNPEVTVPLGTMQPVSIQVFIPGVPDNLRNGGRSTLGATTFTASTDKPYLAVTPSSGTLPPTGTTVTVTASPGSLPAGASTGTLTVTTPGAPPKNTPININLVTPVAPTSKTTPPPNALIIPVVTHVNGVAGPFLSDVRLTNSSAASVKYQIGLTPTGTDAKTSSKVTEVTVGTQETVALNDVVKNFFGFGATGAASDIGFGSLEIRPVASGSSLTFASSRTYASTAQGTFGQFVAAVPFSEFATRRQQLSVPGVPPAPQSAKLSLQQVAQSPRFRTNFGIAEGAGEAATVVLRIFGTAGGAPLATRTLTLKPGEQQQINNFIADSGIPTLQDGRIEVEITSNTGAVTAYASVLDNLTTDPLAVAPVAVDQISSTRYTLPGVADLNNGANNFHSDVRIFNGGTSDVTANLTYYPINLTAAPTQAAPVLIRAGEMKVFDNMLPAFFNVRDGAGSLVVTTATPSSLVVTGRTYTDVVGGGTYGQFIPGVMPEEGLGLGDRPLEVLQIEQTDQFRSNLGLVELTGTPVTVRVTLHIPDSKVTASADLELRGNEFRQEGRIVDKFMGAGAQTYNARVSVRVVGGSGRVAAYSSVIDNKSLDPTYVPGQ